MSLVMPIDYEKGDLFQKVILSDCDSVELFCASDQLQDPGVQMRNIREKLATS